MPQQQLPEAAGKCRRCTAADFSLTEATSNMSVYKRLAVKKCKPIGVVNALTREATQCFYIQEVLTNSAYIKSVWQ